MIWIISTKNVYSSQVSTKNLIRLLIKSDNLKKEVKIKFLMLFTMKALNFNTKSNSKKNRLKKKEKNNLEMKQLFNLKYMHIKTLTLIIYHSNKCKTLSNST